MSVYWERIKREQRAQRYGDWHEYRRYLIDSGMVAARRLQRIGDEPQHEPIDVELLDALKPLDPIKMLEIGCPEPGTTLPFQMP